MAEFSATSSQSDMHKCNTCFAAFVTMEAVKEHYRNDWHVMNAKRRGQNLPPLNRAQFLQHQAANPKKTAKPAAKVFPIKQSATSQAESAKADNAMSMNDKDVKIKDVEEEEEEEDVRPEKPALPVAPHICIFSNKIFDTADDCVAYMATEYGFFIPDAEYLTDVDGLLTYLGEKVKLGHLCLYCQKMFVDGYAVQNHMISKSHCKIAYDTEIDESELSDFYDFSSTYEDVASDEEDEDTMEVTHTGELKLPDGKVLGHRQFRVYYKQYYRPVDDRAPVLAQQREELLRLGCKFGANTFTSTEVATMSDTDVMTTLVRYQKEIRRGQLIEQRAMKRQSMQIQRKEYKRTVDKLRSSENTTAKIRDYHRILM